MTAFPELLKWQLDTRTRLVEGFRVGHKNQLVCAATGAGKTILALFFIAQALKKGYKAVFLADRRSLIHQTAAVADSLGLNPSIFMADDPRFDIYNPFQIASMQTVSRRFWPQADLYIIDEAHTQMSVWTSRINEIRGAVIGLTATPFSAGLGKYFTNLVNASTMHNLTNDGILVPLDIYACTKIDTSNLKIIAGEWDAEEISERGNEILGDIVKEWQTYCAQEQRKTIAFCANVRHCAAVCRIFNEHGIMAAMYTHHTRDRERQEILEDFKKPDSQIQVLVSVEALAKGFDNPYVSCIMDIRPLRKSFSTAVQMWGRALRRAKDKKNAILLDFSGNILRFREDFEELYFHGVASLDKSNKLDKISRENKEKEVKECPQCKYTPFVKKCVKCGFECKNNEPLQHGKGKMKQLQLRYSDSEGREALWLQCVALTKTKGKPETAYGRACHLYKSIMGYFPQKPLEFSGVDPSKIVISDAVKKADVHNRIKYGKSEVI